MKKGGGAERGNCDEVDDLAIGMQNSGAFGFTKTDGGSNAPILEPVSREINHLSPGEPLQYVTAE